MNKRQVEVFTAGCSICEPAIRMVEDLACPDCEVTVHNLSGSGSRRASDLGIKSVPAVVVDGSIVSCCDHRGPDRDELVAAGIGRSLTG